MFYRRKERDVLTRSTYEGQDEMDVMLPSIEFGDSTIIFRTRQSNIGFIFKYAPVAFIITNQDWYIQKN